MAVTWAGLVSWLGAGVLGGLAASAIARERRLGRLTHALLGLFGGASGGMLATALGFGGVASLDWRAAVVAALAALVLGLGAEVAAR